MVVYVNLCHLAMKRHFVYSQNKEKIIKENVKRKQEKQIQLGFTHAEGKNESDFDFEYNENWKMKQ